jgi:hypothetical protein
MVRASSAAARISSANAAHRGPTSSVLGTQRSAEQAAEVLRHHHDRLFGTDEG